MDNLNEIATTWLLRNQRGHSRTEALARCTAHLVDEYSVRGERAATIAMQALAELDSKSEKGYVDVASSTNHLVVVRRPDGNPLAFTLADLIRLHNLHHSTNGAPERLALH